jgi:crossover junction endodeoxyribonuclease RusA
MTSSSRPAAGLRLVLPLPPSINQQYATVGNRRVLSKEARVFKREVKKTIDAALLSNKVSTATERTLQKSLIGVYLTFYFTTPKRRDLDGGLKIALDAICEPLGVDDRAVVDLHLIKQIDPLKPRLEVEIEAIHDWSFDPDYVLLDDPAGEPTPPEIEGE